MSTKTFTCQLVVGDVVEIEYTSVDERKRIRATVSCCTLKNGKGIAIFNDGDKVYSWRPSKSPHGDVTRIDRLPEDSVINPYVRVFCEPTGKFRPVYSTSGEYTYSVKECEHEWSIALPPHGDHICKDCKMVVNDNFQFVGYYGD